MRKRRVKLVHDKRTTYFQKFRSMLLAYEAELHKQNPEHRMRTEEELLSEYYEPDEYACYLFLENNFCVGFAIISLWEMQDDILLLATIEAFYIQPRFRRKKRGEKYMTILLDGCACYSLCVPDNDLASKAFFSKIFQTWDVTTSHDRYLDAAPDGYTRYTYQRKEDDPLWRQLEDRLEAMEKEWEKEW